MFKLSAISIVIGSALMASANYAFAEANTLSSAPDEYFTITATRTERYFMESPVSISTIDAQDIERASADSIADTLRDIPGIQVADAATAGMKRITLRGESSLRVAILVDGQEITDHSTYGAPLLLDTSMVERVEVIRGTSSVLYGGKALGGVINIITKKGGSEPLQVSLSSGYNSATQGQQYAASVYGYVDGFDYRISVSDNDHKDRNTPDGDLEHSSFNNSSHSLYLAKEFDDHRFGITYEQFNLASEIATGMANFTLDMPQRDRSKFAAFYRYEPDGELLKKIHLDAYKQQIDRNFVQHIEMSVPVSPVMSIDNIVDTDIEETLKTSGINSQFDFQLNEQHYVIVGFQLVKDDLDKATTNITQTTRNMPGVPAVATVVESLSIEEASLTTKALYFQDEWQLSDQLIVTAGARQYWVDAELNETSKPGLSPGKNDDSEFIGSIAANYGFDEHNNMRFVFSQGYHYPTLLQIATGATAAGRFINPNANLKAESSDNVELGYRLFTDNWLIDTSLFYTDADDYITKQDCADGIDVCINPENDQVYVNADKAKTTGVELSVNYHVSEHITPYANVTWLSRKETYGSFTTRDTGTPSLYGKLGLKYENEGALLGAYYLDAFLRAASNAKLVEANGSSESYDSWKTVNLALGTRFGEQQNYLVNMEISNIFDSEYTPAKEQLLAPGRSFMLRFSTDF
ncbi:TonB-dependent receptor plug domain-containing protein [Thalassomonas actiniarum]|uniref:TonB-dependent receptor n=1 Tax=Thalassomonas actiniarum TaxID=485447 RepID=A0AAE9YT85_9GAMM|nr:TonB-dependent receptor [Thalassomonas actiniarum]WDE00761.1 TonB-dependent receptor [Thalassomonas actiniarum]